jgi:hypothetical protein
VFSEERGFRLHIVGISICRGGKCAHINSFVILVLKGSPVIQRAHRLYVKRVGLSYQKFSTTILAMPIASLVV